MMLELNETSRQKLWFLLQAYAYVNVPYEWSGQDGKGIDCSGLVCECLKAIGKLEQNRDLDVDGIWNRFKLYEQPAVPHFGCLAFWFKGNDGKHVAICLDDKHCISATAYDEKNRSVKIHPLNYRDQQGLDLKYINIFP